MEKQLSKIVILGTGNVATHLALLLDDKAEIVQVWSRDKAHAEKLCSKLKAETEPVSDYSAIRKDADFYVIAVPDAAVLDVARNLKGMRGIVAHTSGSVSLNSLLDAVGNDKAGVFYPLQTFSKKSKVKIAHIPFLIEGATGDVSAKLSTLAKLISDEVFIIGSDMRGHLHLAAVLANNFTNYLLDLSARYLKDNTKFNIKVLEPLMVETVRKAIELGPHLAQTGPAVRNDTQVIDAHLSKLSPDAAEVYKFLSDRISRDHADK